MGERKNNNNKKFLMSSLSDSLSPKVIATLSELRLANNLTKDFIKAADKHVNALSSSGTTAAAFVEGFARLVSNKGGDIGEGLGLMNDAVSALTKSDLNVTQALREHVLGALKKRMDSEKEEVESFAKECASTLKKMKNEAKALEKACKSAKKKGGTALDQAMAALDEKTRQFDDTKVQQTRDALLIRRKRFCNLVNDWVPVMKALIQIANETQSNIAANIKFWEELAASSAKLPDDHGGGGGGGVLRQSSQPPMLGNSEGGGGGNTMNFNGGGGGNTMQFGGGGAPPASLQSEVLYTVTALYDCAAEHDGDLAFRAGDAISIIAEDDPAWLTGYCNGNVGLLPRNYVK